MQKSEAPAPAQGQSAPAAAAPQADARQTQNSSQEQNRASQQDQQKKQQQQRPQQQQQQSQPPKNQTPPNTPSTQPEEAQAMTSNQTPNNSTQTTAEEATPRALDIPSSPYQRPGQAPVRAGAGYPGAYPATAYPARSGGAPISSVAVAPGERKLTIGRGIAISGEIESCDHLIVEGTVEAALKGASVLEIAENGTFYGTVDIDEATVAGRFEGDITVHGRLTIRSTGTITGSIAYKELEVESGAVIDGRLTPVNAAATAAAAENRKQNQQGGNKHAKKDNRNHNASAANSDEGLFSAKAAAE
jgi:cytoskeletal protein CcmA (bactofilin family)